MANTLYGRVRRGMKNFASETRARIKRNEEDIGKIIELRGQGLSYEKIGNRLNIPKSTVRYIFYRMRDV